MSKTLNFNLTPRREGNRSVATGIAPVHFNLQQIKVRFDSGCSAIRKEDAIATMLENSGQQDESMRILRSQIVFLEGILDFYIHEMSKYALYHMFLGQWSKSEQYCSILIPMKEVEKSIDAPEQKEWFYDFVNRRMSREVYLSADSMNKQLNLIGLPFAEVMIDAFKSQFPEKRDQDLIKIGKNIISGLFDRRNKIVHQDDRDHGSAAQSAIDAGYVDKCFNDVKAIVSAIQKIAEEK